MKEVKTYAHDYPFYKEQKQILLSYLAENPEKYTDKLKDILK
jgi:hypothetical protein